MRRSCHYPTCHRCNALSNIRSAGIESGIGHSVEKNPMNSAFMELCTRKSRHTGPSASEPMRPLWYNVPEKFITLDLLHMNLFVLGQCEHFRACHRCNTLPKYRMSCSTKLLRTAYCNEPNEMRCPLVKLENDALLQVTLIENLHIFGRAKKTRLYSSSSGKHKWHVE